MPSQAVVEDASARRAAYLARLDEVLKWRVDLVKPGELFTDMSIISAKLERLEYADLCSRSIIQTL